MEEGDKGFIYSTWPRGVFYGSIHPLTIPKQEWFELFGTYMELALKNAAIRVACMEDLILGYSVIMKHELQWVYVKQMYRKQGIAAILLATGFDSINNQNLTKIGLTILTNHEREEHDRTSDRSSADT